MKVKISLTPELSQGYGHLLYCCGKYQPVVDGALQENEIWNCVDCEKPILLRYGDEYYLVGQNVTI